MQEFSKANKPITVAVIVAHPDDETLWAGGTILSHPLWDCFIISLCRGSDPDRAPKFFKALQQLDSKGTIADLDDGPEQKPLAEKKVEEVILELLPKKHYDLILTHNPNGEYYRHLRHEETSKAVILLWNKGKISTNELWTFAYEDGKSQHKPIPIVAASSYIPLLTNTWQSKYKIITETYGFKTDSWEAETTPKAEAFWKFSTPVEAKEWLTSIEIES